jgi:hypothetical protein
MSPAAPVVSSRFAPEIHHAAKDSATNVTSAETTIAAIAPAGARNALVASASAGFAPPVCRGCREHESARDERRHDFGRQRSERRNEPQHELGGDGDHREQHPGHRRTLEEPHCVLVPG